MSRNQHGTCGRTVRESRHSSWIHTEQGKHDVAVLIAIVLTMDIETAVCQSAQSGAPSYSLVSQR